MMLVVIKFKAPCPPFNSGEIAGVEKKVADRHVKNGIAEYVDKKAPLKKDLPLVNKESDSGEDAAPSSEEEEKPRRRYKRRGV